MIHRVRIPLLLASLLVAAVGLVYQPNPNPRAPAREAAPEAARTERVVFVGGGLEEVELLTFTVTLAASAHPGVMLLDSPKESSYLKAFLAAYRPEQVI